MYLCDCWHMRAVASANGVIWCLVYFRCTHPPITIVVSEGLIAFYAARVANCPRVNYGLIVKTRVVGVFYRPAKRCLPSCRDRT